MADESAASAHAAPNAEGEQRVAWTATEWRAHEVVLRAAAADADCSSDVLVGLVNEVTCSLAASVAPADKESLVATMNCVGTVMRALYTRPTGDAPLRAAVTAALYACTGPRCLGASVAFYQHVVRALVLMLDEFSLDETEQALRAVSALDSYVRAWTEGSDGEPRPPLMTGELATATAVTLSRACVRYNADANVSRFTVSALGALLQNAGDRVVVRRAALDTTPSLPHMLMTALTLYGEAQSDDRAIHAGYVSMLLEQLAGDAEVAALLRAEPGAATGEAASLRAAVRAMRACATSTPTASLGALFTAENLVGIFTCTLKEIEAGPTSDHGAGVRSGLVDFQIELLLSRCQTDARLFSHVLHTLHSLLLDESDSIARKVATQPAVNAAFAALRAHAETLDTTEARLLSQYLFGVAGRFDRRPKGSGITPAVLASAFMPLLRAHLDDGENWVAIVSAMQLVSAVADTPCGSMALMRTCVPVLLEALQRHVTDPHVGSHIATSLACVVVSSFGALSPLVPPELGNLRSVVALLATAVRTAVDAASRLPAAGDEGGLMRRRAASLARPVRALADAVVPFQDEVVRDPAMLAALTAMLHLQPGGRDVVQIAAGSLLGVLRIDQSGSRVQKRAVVALLRSTRLGAAFCAAVEATGQAKPHIKLVLDIVAFFTRHGLHVDSSRGATPRAARTCDACGAVETQEQLAALSAGSAKHRLCGRCLRVSYCSIACQHAAWPTHKATCRAATEE